MKGITALALMAALQFGVAGCASQQTYCRCDSSSGDVSSAPEARTPDDAPADQSPFVPDVETSPSDVPATEGPASAAPAASDEAAKRTSEPAARTATRPDAPKRLVPAQSPQFRGRIEG